MFALLVLAAADFLVVLDGLIVSVALPSIQRDLGFTQAGLQWVVNAYLLAFGGFSRPGWWTGSATSWWPSSDSWFRPPGWPCW